MDVKCPLCHTYLEDEDGLSLGEIIYCPKCFKDFEVVKLKPVRLQKIKAWAPDNEEDEDWDREEYYD
jgi:lysine biosynthesis protein LysW